MTETDNIRREHRSIYLNDINAVLPEGKRNFFSFVTFDDFSTVHWTNFFATNRTEALNQVMERFADCTEYIHSISIHESED